MMLDDEFQALIPPLSQEEKAQLEASLVADGCRDPLVVWPLPIFTVDYSDEQDGSDLEAYSYAEPQHHSHYTQDEGVSQYKTWGADEEVSEEDWPCLLLDGHNRLEICTRLGLTYEVVNKEFECREDVIVWMIDNQDGRRNQPPFVRVEMQLKKKAALEKKAKARQQGGQGGILLPANSPEANPIDTREEIAVNSKVGSSTVSAVERILATSPEPEILSAVRADDVSINLAAQFVALPEAAQHEAIPAVVALPSA